MTAKSYLIDKEKLNKYLHLFGLPQNFTIEELTSSFRILAKLNHPDINKDKNSVGLMSDINEGYHFLKEALSGAETINDQQAPDDEEKKRALDIFYDQYKKGFTILKTAFEDYYGEAENKSREGDGGILKKELLRAKIEFAVLINELPYNQWVNDAIDKINSINKWLD